MLQTMHVLHLLKMVTLMQFFNFHSVRASSSTACSYFFLFMGPGRGNYEALLCLLDLLSHDVMEREFQTCCSQRFPINCLNPSITRLTAARRIKLMSHKLIAKEGSCSITAAFFCWIG